MGPKPKTIESRFVSRMRTGPGCWEWTGGKTAYGYGSFGLADGMYRRAHQVSYMLNIGPIPAGLCVLHKCDNPGCVNPQHLFLGTRADNAHDCHSKGRYSHVSRNAGMSHGASKLTDAIVREIRKRNAAGESQHSLARKFRVCVQLINGIVHRRGWRHVV